MRNDVFPKFIVFMAPLRVFFPGTNAVRYYFMAWLPKTLPDGIVQHLSTSFEMQNISDLTKAFESNL